MTLPTWERFALGALGASLVTVPALYNGIVADSVGGAQPVSIGTVIMLCLAWVAAVWVAGRMTAEHVFEPLLNGIGIPGLVVSAAVGLQAVN